jgi:hypothetical protein
VTRVLSAGQAIPFDQGGAATTTEIGDAIAGCIS